MSAIIYNSRPSATALAADSSDPNTATPDETRTFQGCMTGRTSTPTPLWVCAIGGAVTLQLWVYFNEVKRWFKCGAATACTQDTLTYFPATPPGDADNMFLQNTGTPTATQIVAGLQGAR